MVRMWAVVMVLESVCRVLCLLMLMALELPDQVLADHQASPINQWDKRSLVMNSVQKIRKLRVRD